MREQVPVESPGAVDFGKDKPDEKTFEIAPDVACKRLGFVNVFFVGSPSAGDRQWTLIDTGIPGFAEQIEKAAAQRFGARSRPGAIILTHGHFDHVGGLRQLAKKWNVSIYAHPLEMPYLDGHASYPPPEPSWGDGLMSAMSPLFPKGPIDVASWLRPLHPSGTLPSMSGWEWIHTPGHSAGHISLWRDLDRTLIAGDAFVTTNQESIFAVATQKPEIHGPPRYFTPDWPSARDSVRTLAALHPVCVATGHGKPMKGPDMLAALELLAQDFDNLAIPENSHYVTKPSTPEDGSAYRAP